MTLEIIKENYREKFKKLPIWVKNVLHMSSPIVLGCTDWKWKMNQNKFVLLTIYNDQGCWLVIDTWLELSDDFFFCASNGQSKH